MGGQIGHSIKIVRQPNKLAESILKVCGVFNKNFVEYIIVGGTAVALHGYFRRSMNMAGAIADKPDLDFWYNPTYQNYFKLSTRWLLVCGYWLIV